MDRESLELLLSQGLSIEKIAKRFGKHPSTVSYWMGKHGLTAVNRQKHAARGGIDRERLEALVRAGMTIAEITGELHLSAATVRYWLKRHGLRTQGGHRIAVTRDGRNAGLLSIPRICVHHGETEFALEARGYYRCKRCRSDGITQHRRRLKALLVEEMGGRCRLCGYDRCVAALEFHHRDPVEKRLGISAGGLTLSREAVRAEVGKCILLCSNCHAEVENGVTPLPVECSSGFGDES
jgi:transposase